MELGALYKGASQLSETFGIVAFIPTSRLWTTYGIKNLQKGNTMRLGPLRSLSLFPLCPFKEIFS